MMIFHLHTLENLMLFKKNLRKWKISPKIFKGVDKKNITKKFVEQTDLFGRKCLNCEHSKVH